MLDLEKDSMFLKRDNLSIKLKRGPDLVLFVEKNISQMSKRRVRNTKRRGITSEDMKKRNMRRSIRIDNMDGMVQKLKKKKPPINYAINNFRKDKAEWFEQPGLEDDFVNEQNQPLGKLSWTNWFVVFNPK